MNPEVELFISHAVPWNAELAQLRRILLNCGLDEALKWHNPCYSYGGKNICIIGGLKDCCVLSFFKGALLTDEKKILRAPGANTQSARVVKFTDAKSIVQVEPLLKAYINEAIELERSGAKLVFKKKEAGGIPAELAEQFLQDEAFKNAFHLLTPGRQRGYLLHFSQPKQAKTRLARIEKNKPRILEGLGLADW